MNKPKKNYWYVFGLGKSGRSAVCYLENKDIPFLTWDDSVQEKDLPMVSPENIDWTQIEKIVLSPGIPHTGKNAHSALLKAQENHIPLIGDMELFLQELEPHHTVVGITGTNGKSTTTSLLCHLLQHFGCSSVAAGNIGLPVLDLPKAKNKTFYILELSSYQLTLMKNQRLDMAILLNITPDHLAYHGSMEHYVLSKRRVFDLRKKDAPGIIEIDSQETLKIYQNIPGLVGVSVEDPHTLPVLENLPGIHNIQNILICQEALKKLIPDQFDTNTFIAGLKSFSPLAHRQEILKNTGSLVFVNDSKATNMDAASTALKAFNNIHWILGGKAKEGEGPLILSSLFSKVKHAYLIGDATDAFEKKLKGQLPTTSCRTIEIALESARKIADAGDIILLSPGCASFDQFKNFEDRGNHFKSCVTKLLEKYRD